MGYRHILVHVDARSSAPDRARLAAHLAARQGAHLTGVFLTSDFFRQYGAFDGIAGLSPEAIDDLLKDQRKATDDASEAARSTFESTAADAGVKSEWLSISGDDHQPTIGLARRADLTVFPLEAAANFGQNRISAAQLALACGGPVLVVPPEVLNVDIGKRVLVAWNGGREAARALKDAWPLIAQAEEVHVLIVSPKEEDSADGALQRLFEHHGLQANVIVYPSDDLSAPDVILEHVKSLSADLVVMGLYGRPRLQELVLGGVSRELLARCSVPLLVSH